MIVLLLHLSDIHIIGDSDAILGRAEHIAKAVRSVGQDADACTVIISGDIANSGAEAQYVVAGAFFDELLRHLRSVMSEEAPISTVAIPGNHDCDLSAEQGVRDLVIGNVQEKWSLAGNPEIVDVCTHVQDAFFGFLPLIGVEPPSGVDRQYYELTHEYEGGKKILYCCYNTAWMSQLQEKPGRMVYPVRTDGEAVRGYDLIISVMHHPYNWFFPDNGRSVRKYVEATSDLILTGHEHDQSFHTRTGSEGEVNEYIEGGVLQETGHDHISRFNVILTDLTNRRQKIHQFRWNGEFYSPGEAGDYEWRDLQVNQLVVRNDFAISDSTQEWLEDPEAALTHSRRGRVQLSDVFVYPDLREVNYRNDLPPLIGGEQILERILADERVLITGSERCGKTSLAKTLFQDFHRRGLIPVYIDAENLRAQYDERLLKQIHKAFEAQYSSGALEKYKQLARDQRVLLIDNFHALAINRRGREKVLGILSQFSSCVLVFANDLTQQVRDLTSTGAQEPSLTFAHFRILEFGHVLRDQLVERWFALGEDYTTGELTLAKRVSDIHEILNTVIGKNFVPSFPIFILSILQAEESSQQIDTTASTYGHFYELFLKSSLAKGSKPREYDEKLSYLAFVAHTLFKRNTRQLTPEELREIHDSYEKEYAARIDFRTVIGSLLDKNILGFDGSYYVFRYKWVYYYFVARYLNDYITDPEVRASIGEITGRLYVEEYANILLFLAHLSKNPFITDQLLEKARALYSDVKPAELASDVRFLNEAYSAVRDVVYVESDPRDTRRRMLERMDELNEDEETEFLPEDVLEDPDLDPILQLNVALKTLQITGQILKNFPTSIRAERKRELTEECYLLGLRSLGAVFAMLEEHQEGLIQDIVRLLRVDYPGDDQIEILKKAKVELFGLSKAMAYGMIKKISQAVGSDRLGETYRQVLANHDLVSIELIDTALKLDHTHTTRFPEREITDLGKSLEKNYIAGSILRQLVVSHFYLFPIDLATRKSVCDRLEIPIQEGVLFNPRKKLIAKGPGGSS